MQFLGPTGLFLVLFLSFEANWLCIEEEFDAIFYHLFLEVRCAVPILSRQKLTSNFEHGHFCAKASEPLTQFTADRATPEDYHRVRELRQVKDGFRCVNIDLFYALDVGYFGPAAGCDACLFE